MRPSHLVGYVVLTAVLLPAVVTGQVGPGGPSGPPPSGCTINTNSAPLLRSEAITEAVSDLIFTCQQMPALPAGQAVPQVNITVTLPAPVTSRLLNGNISEALLLIDEPNSGLTPAVPGFGPAQPFTVCTTPLTGCPAWAQQVTIGTTTFAVAVNSPTASASPANAASNVFQGVVSGDQVTFYGVPVLPPGPNGARVFRITNIRINASRATIGTAVQATLSVSDPTDFPLLSSPAQIVAYPRTSFSASVTSPAQFAACNSQALQQATILSYRGDIGAFKIRGSLTQNVPGLVYKTTESDFTLPIPGSATAGLADFGTRLKAVFNNVPAGVRLFVPLTDMLVDSNGAQQPGSNAQLVTGETTPFAVPTATAQAPGTNINLVEITPPSGSYTATAVWEIVTPVGIGTLQFPAYLSYTGSAAPGLATVNLSEAPTSGITIPRFLDTSTPLTAFSVAGCQAPVPLTLTASANPSAFGQPVTFTASLGAAGSGATGAVQFFDGTTLLGTANLTNGQAVFTTSVLTPGSHAIIAKYSGDGMHQPAQVSLGQVISPLTSTVSLTASASNIIPGQTDVFSAQVGPAPPSGVLAQTGQVLFQDNGAPVATVTLSSGTANLNLSTLSLGTHTITAVYTGDSTWGASHASVTVTVTTPPLQLTNAANSLSTVFAADETASIFNVIGINGNTGATLPLGSSLAGVTVTVKDSAGEQRAALLYGAFAPTEQVNFVVPAGTAPGTAALSVTTPAGTNQSTHITIGKVAPGIFTVNQNGQGMFAGQIVSVNPDGSRTVAESATLSGNTFTATPVNLSGADAVFLQLYGTGLRHASAVTATINGTNVTAEYAGAQGIFPGLDQVNLQIPNSLAGAGTVNIVITADGQPTNTVTALIQ